MNKTIGKVRVDAGMVSLIKEEDVKLFAKRGTGNLLGFAFWGRDREQTSESMKKIGIGVNDLKTVSFISVSDLEEEVLQQFYEYIQQDNVKVVVHPVHDNPYDRLFIEDTTKMRVQTEREELFYTSSTYFGDGVYNVFENKGTNTFHAFFGDEVHVSVELLTNQLDTIEVTEPTNYLFADPCYLGYEETHGTTITLQPGVKYYVYQMIDAEDQLPVSLIVTGRKAVN